MIITRYPTSKGIKNAITWKLLFRRKLTFLSKLDLSEAITFQIPVAATLNNIHDFRLQLSIHATPFIKQLPVEVCLLVLILSTRLVPIFWNFTVFCTGPIAH